MLWAIGFAYIGLLCALVLVTFRAEEPMRRTALVLLADMAFGYLYSFTLGTGWDYSAFMIIVNALACILITWHPAGKWQSLIGLSFILQIGTDTGRVASELYFGTSDNWAVYWMTTLLAYSQLAMLLGWWIADGGLVRNRGWGRHHPLSAAPRRSGLA